MVTTHSARLATVLLLLSVLLGVSATAFDAEAKSRGRSHRTYCTHSSSGGGGGLGISLAIGGLVLVGFLVYAGAKRGGGSS
ncbi:hypothetical protein [Streptomyces sp. NBC_01262]|uniref:hypothetical protein n=1 Tax=Streptomyces sp. NBC_01262 TaxID=2903803 RepID=UPI002E34C898|nr:hypothetical protein [Streptomyces sp. NBC_01262]